MAPNQNHFHSGLTWGLEDT